MNTVPTAVTPSFISVFIITPNDIRMIDKNIARLKFIFSTFAPGIFCG